MNRELLFSLGDDICREKYLIATYTMELPASVDIIDKASTFAVGQTIGTWTKVPGMTESLYRNHVGKVVNIFDVPPCDITGAKDGDTCCYVVQIAFPIVNFGAQYSMLLTTLLGNDASTSAQAKLVDIQFPESYIQQFRGPRFGISGLREITGVSKRPLLLNMIKPCTGLTVQEGANIFYETALGGVDFIKDDELLGALTSFSTAEARVTAFRKAAEAAYEKTGTRTRYVVNITCDTPYIYTVAQRAVELGADAVMVNFSVLGYGVLREIAEKVGIPVIAHYAASGMMYEGTHSGICSPLVLGKLTRLAGADAVIINSPYGGYPLKYQKFIQTVNALTLPMCGKKASMPIVGGKVHPGTVRKYTDQLGFDIMLGAGGSIQGHPDGPAAGARAMRQAIEAAVCGEDVYAYAKTKPELEKALRLWGVL